ncbi:MAG TPA: FecR family protein [Bryobacteraceae bacterium]|nr:FecR family protein [Bryobacteraceae bacterium]
MKSSLGRYSFGRTARKLLITATVAMCCAFSLAAQDFTGAAKVQVMSGRVSVLQDSVEWALSPGKFVQPQQVVVTGPDGYAKFELQDGSTFEVFQNSRTVFRPAQGWSQLLDVFLGRVKVYIQHNHGPNHQQVTTQTAVISVRGTIFDVVVDDEDTTFVSVDDGIVVVRHKLFPGTETEVHAGEAIQVYRNQPLARRMDKGNAARMALRAAAQAAYEALYHRPVGTGAGVPTGGSTGGGVEGDKGGTKGNAPPPPPPAPPPPPPPPPGH